MSKYYFVVDTDSYVGNYEREMCAYMTGVIGECCVGEENAERFRKEVAPEMQDKIGNLISSESDDHGVCRPVKICPTPCWEDTGWGESFRVCNDKKIKNPAYNSIAIGLTEFPKKEIINFLVERAYKYDGLTRSGKKGEINVESFRIIEKITAIKETYIENGVKNES